MKELDDEVSNLVISNIYPNLCFYGVCIYRRNDATYPREATSITKSPPSTATTLPTSTLTPAIMDTEPSATLSPTLPPTPVDSLEPEIAKATLEPLLRDPLNCAIPCFWGIIPGKTDFDEARTLFSRLGFTPFEGTDPNSGRDFYTISYESSIGRRSAVTLLPTNHQVKNIVITPEIVKQKEGSPREWIAYSPETLIRKYGKPSRVEFALDWGPNFVIVMILYFEASDLIALYSGYNMIPDRPRSPRVCPLTAPFDHVRLWIGPNPPNPPLTGSPDPLEKGIPLEEATSLTVDQFTDLMLGDPQQACFTVNGDVFP
jgi:hypothetical protein